MGEVGEGRAMLESDGTSEPQLASVPAAKPYGDRIGAEALGGVVAQPTDDLAHVERLRARHRADYIVGARAPPAVLQRTEAERGDVVDAQRSEANLAPDGELVE